MYTTAILATGMLAISYSKAWSQTDQNTFIGYKAGFSTTSAVSNTFLGFQAGYNTATGSQNLFFGNAAGFSNSTGEYNMFLGNLTGYYNTTGRANTFIGAGSGFQNSIGSDNSYIGANAGIKTTTGSGNTFLGRDSGSENVSGSNNTFIGYGSGVLAANNNLTNATTIGANTKVTASNAIILGSGVNVGIGNTAPNNKLEITQGIANQSGLRFTNLTSSSPASVTNQYKFLTVNANGDVILGSLTGSTRVAVSSELWQTDKENVQNTNAGGVIIGSRVSQTPVGYKLYVEQGILTEKVKVAVKNTSEWSDNVFEAEYPLKSLPDVAGYIKANKHLPGIPSAREMVERGNDLHQTDARLLEKIEELTLYLIELKNENERLKQAVSSLKSDNKLIKHTLRLRTFSHRVY